MTTGGGTFPLPSIADKNKDIRTEVVVGNSVIGRTDFCGFLQDVNFCMFSKMFWLMWNHFFFSIDVIRISIEIFFSSIKLGQS